MAVAVGPALRIEPHRSASIAGEYTALAELVAPATSFRLVAVVTATALLGTEPAMGTIRLWDQTYKGFSQVQFYGTQTLVIHIPTVTAGDLVQVTASPWLDDGGYWAGARVWIQKAEITLVDFADVPASPPTYAPPLWPTQLSATDDASSTIIGYSLGDSWGLAVTSTSWRFRPAGSDVWTTLTGQTTTGEVSLPFDLVDSSVAWEVSGQQSTGAGPSEWGPIVVWSAPSAALVWTLDDVTVGSGVWFSSDGVEAAIHPAHIPYLAEGAALVKSLDIGAFTVSRTGEADFADGAIVWTMCLTMDWTAGAMTLVTDIADWNFVTRLVGPDFDDQADGWAWWDNDAFPIPADQEFNPATAGLAGWMKGHVRLTKNTATGVFTMAGSTDGVTWTALGGGTHFDNGPMGGGIIFDLHAYEATPVAAVPYYLHSLSVTDSAAGTLIVTEADIVAATPASYTLGNAAQFPEPWTVSTTAKVINGSTSWVPTEHAPIWVDGVSPVWQGGPILTNPKIIWSPSDNPALMSELSLQPTSGVPARGWVWQVRGAPGAATPGGGGGYGFDYGNDYGGT